MQYIHSQFVYLIWIFNPNKQQCEISKINTSQTIGHMAVSNTVLNAFIRNPFAVLTSAAAATVPTLGAH